MANKKLTPLEILYREFKNAKTDAARNEAWRRFEIKRGENKNLLDEIAERNYKDELEKIMNTKRYEWRRQLENDSLNRVFGHELGRKIGKYRASRGKPVNP